MKEKVKELSKKWWFWVIVVVIVIGIVGIIGASTGSDDNYSSGKDTNYGESTNKDTSNKKEEKPKELTESEKMIVKLSSLIDEGLAFDTGSYIKGDIPSGEYAFVKFDGSGSYYGEEDAAGNIIDNENFDSFGYVKVHAAGNLDTRGVLVSVNAFEKLGVSGAKQIYEILNNQTDYNQGGYYKVGTDIEAGTYIIESIGGRAYYAVMTGPVGNSDIVNNDNFSGRKQVTVKNGQYLTVSRASITKQ